MTEAEYQEVKAEDLPEAYRRIVAPVLDAVRKGRKVVINKRVYVDARLVRTKRSFGLILTAENGEKQFMYITRLGYATIGYI